MVSGISINVVSCMMLMIISLSSLFMGVMYMMKGLVVFVEWELMGVNSSSIVMTLLFDWMSLMFMGFVLFISSLVIYYSKEYMGGDENMNRFIILVLMFVASMMLLIISPNLISILLGWDGLGLVSYCLVIYYQNVKSFNAGMITALSNRVGDVALLMAIAWMFNYGGWNYWFMMEFFKGSLEMQVVGALVVLAGMTKSAQIPFSAWLPAAMAAPTPVSALVHSSTLVTAGVFLLIRFNEVLMDGAVGQGLLMIASMTMFMAGIGANFEFDLKKIIALSTLSQLGLMMMILSLGFPVLAFFHLLTHALFKALLFLCAGAVIHNMKDSQDIRFMGGLVNIMPYTCSCMNVANLALCGMPFLAGFYSKDVILEMVSMGMTNVVIFLLAFVSTGMTVCYSFRLVYYVMSGDFNSGSSMPLQDEGWVMSRSMTGLMIVAVVGGSTLSWIILPSPCLVALPLGLKMLVLMVSGAGGWLGYMISEWSVGEGSGAGCFKGSFFFLGSMWFMPYLSTFWMSGPVLSMGGHLQEGLDQGWSEEMGGQGIYKFFSGCSFELQWWQDNNFSIFLLMIFMWFVFVILVI